MNSTPGKKNITSDCLKWIAVITMVIDHIGAAILEKTYFFLSADIQKADFLFRKIGRLSFPIFCFLLVEGFYHTRSRKKYLVNILLFAVISEIPFEAAFFDRLVWGFRNVYWTLAIGLLMMILIENLKETEWVHKELYSFLLVGGAALLSGLLQTDYPAVGVLLVYILYKTRTERKKQCILGAIAMSYEITAPLSFLLIYFYNGQRKQKRFKYFFYLFYPLHLFVLYKIRIMIT